VGEEEAGKPWIKAVDEVVKKAAKLFSSIEAVIVFGSWSRSGGGEWSDVDVLIITDDAEKYSILERFAIAVELRAGRTDVFIYSYRELESMAMRGNPLALSALVEGVKITSSKRVEELSRKLSETYTRRGRMWMPRS